MGCNSFILFGPEWWLQAAPAWTCEAKRLEEAADILEKVVIANRRVYISDFQC